MITVDDALPSFQQNTFSFSLREDDEDGTELGDLGATDEGENTRDILLCHSVSTEMIINATCDRIHHENVKCYAD